MITLPTNTSPRVRDIGAHYFDSLNQSQVWVNIEPEPLEPGPTPILLNLTVAFPGRQLNQQPPTVTLRAQTPCFPMVFPERVRQPILRVVLNEATTLDLTAPGRIYHLTPSCGKASADAIVTDLPFGVLQQIIGEADVVIHALGFSARLVAADLIALRTFGHTMASGVVVRERVTGR
jgi:hypothetical protein